MSVCVENCLAALPDEGGGMESGFDASQIDTSRPHPARMYNYYLGGKDNYQVDREAAEQVLRVVPDVRAMARENRAFMQRAVRFLVGEAGIRQIIDVGTGIPSAGNVHEIARGVADHVRVVYVDNDPIVHVHASALLSGTGTTGIVLADLREPEAILAHPKIRELIDFAQPLAVLLVAIMHFVTDEENPGRIVRVFRDAMPPGSYLVLSHGTGDHHTEEKAGHAAGVYQRATAPLVLRSRSRIEELFDGFTLIEPGLVQTPLWRPEQPRRKGKNLPGTGIYAGIGYLPGPAEDVS
jgi:hypothetical protein